jgi:hypothetical protein
LKEALASGPKTTKDLALAVIAVKRLDTGDKVLARYGDSDDPCAAAAMAARAFGRRGEGQGGAGVGSEALVLQIGRALASVVAPIRRQ